MKLSRLMPLACALIFAAALAGCSSDMNKNAGENAATPAASPSASPAAQTLTEVERPPKVKEMQAARGEQEDAKPSLKIVEPKEGATVSGSTVKLELDLGGELKGYKPGKDPATMVGNDPSTMKGNHIHVILDNQPYEAYYNLDQPFELRNVTEGPHTIRVFPSRPWHESYKNDGAFQMVTFTVKDGGEAKYIDKWEPIWLTGWTAGKHTVKLELVDKNGNPVENGGYNTTTREITITK